MSHKIYEDDKAYFLLRRVVDFFIRRSYSRIVYEGLENIPKDGAVILAPNHANALMDPLVVLALNHEKKVFVARADVFRKPAIANLLTFFKIMPINRRRDGIRSVIQTDETIKKSIEVLNNKVKFCILSEGTHRPKHSLLKIGKGIARVAYGTYETIEEGCPVYILPIGCEYGDYYRFRSTAHVQIGKPLNITEFIEDRKDSMSEHDIMEGIREITDAAMREQIIYLPDDEDYDGSWVLTKIGAAKVPRLDVKRRFETDRKLVGSIQDLKKKAPEKISSLMSRAVAFEDERKKAKITLHSASCDNLFLRAVGGSLNALIGLPLFLIFAITSLPVWIVGEALASRVKDRAFCNSMRCGSLVFVWTLVWLVESVVMFCTMPFGGALVAVFVNLFSPMVVYDYFEFVRQCASRWRALFNNNVRKEFRLIADSLAEAIKE